MNLGMESLESRQLLAVDIWTGASLTSSNWSDDANWQDGSAPTTGDDLIFSLAATNKTSIYDSALGVSSFGSITIESAGYDISSSFSSSLTLTNGLFATYDSSISNFDISFDPGSSGTVEIGTGATLSSSGVISGTSGLNVSGGGTFRTAGTSSNTYSGGTTVSSGSTMVLDKTGATAIPGDLSINASGTVMLAQSHQIADTSQVIAGTLATLDLNNFDDTLAGLNLSGATVATGTGTLTLGGDVTTNSDPYTSLISGNLDLGGATRTFTVADNAQLDPDLDITANISGTGAGLIKAGANSQLKLSGNNTYDGTTTISSGAIEIASDNALGSSLAGTIVNSGTSLALLGDITSPEPITISGVGFGGLGAIFNGYGNNTITGPITLGSNSTIGSLSGTLTFAGAISDGASSFALTKVRPGTVAFTTANSYDGGTTVTGGVLAISDGSALGTGSVSISNGAELDLSNDITLSRNISFRGTGMSGNGALRSVSGNNTYSGTATLQASGTRITVDSGQLTLSGDLTDGSNGYIAEKYGSGVLLITGNLTSSGLLNSVEGEVRVDGSYGGAVVLAGGNISGTGTPGSIDHVDGTVGTVNPGDGGTTIGTLTTTNGYAVRTNATTHIDIGGTSAGTTYDQIIAVPGGVILTGSNIEVSLINGFIPVIGDIFTIIDDQASDTITGTFLNLAEGATFQSGPVTFQVSYSGGDGNDVTLSVIAVTFTWTGLGSDGLWSTAANWDTNTTPSNGLDIVFGSGAARLTNTNDMANLSLRSITFGGSGYMVSGNGISLSDGFSTTFVAGSSVLDLDVDLTASQTIDVSAGGEFYLNGGISGSGFGITKTGDGTLTFGGGTNANSYTGTTTVNAGRLNLFKDAGTNAFGGDLVIGDSVGTGDSVWLLSPNQIPDASTVTIFKGASLDLDGNDETTGSLYLTGGAIATGAGILTTSSGSSINSYANDTTSTISGFLSFSGPNNAISVAQGTTSTGVDLEISAVIGSMFNLIKSGGGKLLFSGANTYSGGTNVNSGILSLSNSTAAGLGVVNILGAGTLEVSGGITLNNMVNAASSGTAIHNAGGSNAFSGEMNLAADTTFDVDEESTLAVTGEISGTGTFLAKTGMGRMILAGSNSYAGNTWIYGGTLRATADRSFGDPTVSASIIVNDMATLEISGGVTLPGSRSISVSGLSFPGTGKIVNLAGDNTIFGSISLLGGNNESIDVAAGSVLTIVGPISGSVDLDKNGAGTLYLEGSNSLIGSINALDGTLIVNGNVSTVSQIFVDGVLGGYGTLPNVVVSDIGTLSPGNSPGIMTANSLSFSSSGSQYDVQLNGMTAGAEYDQTRVLGDVNLSGATLLVSMGFGPAIGSTFQIIDNLGPNPIQGTFNGLSEGATFVMGSATLQISYTGGDGNDVTLSVIDVSYSWTGLGGDDYWSTSANWAGNVVPTAGSNLVFLADASRFSSTNDLASGTEFHSIVIAGGNYEMFGNEIKLSGGITVAEQSGLNLNINVEITDNITIVVGDASGLGFYSSIFGPGYGLTKTGNGLLVLLSEPASSTFTGTTTVLAGALFLNSPNIALPGDLVVGDGQGTTVFVQYFQSNQIADGSKVTITEGAFINFAGNSDQIDALVLEGGSIQLAGGTISVLSSITVNASPNHYTSYIDSGTLDLGSNLVTFDIADDPSVGTELAVSALVLNGAVFKAGGGRLELSGDNSYSDGTTIQAGELVVSHSHALGSGVVTIDGGVLEISNFIALTNPIEIMSEGLAIRNLDGMNTLLGSISLDDSVIDVASGSSLFLGGVVSDVGGGTGHLTKTGGGLLDLSGTNTYSGTTAVQAGTLQISNSQATGLAGTVSVASGTTLLQLSSTYNLPLGGLQIGDNSGTASYTALTNEPFTLMGNVLLLGDSNFQVSGAGSLNITGTMSGSGDLILPSSNEGLVILSVANTATGQTIVNGGLLQVSQDSNLSEGTLVLDRGTLLVSESSVIDNNIFLGGFGGTVTSSNDSKLTGDISGPGSLVKSGPGTLALSGGNTFDGSLIVDEGGLILDGSDNVPILSTTPVTVELAGTLTFLNDLTIGSLDGAGILNAGINYVSVGGNSANSTFSGMILGDGQFIKVGFGTLTLSGSSPFEGQVIVNAGTLVVDGSLASTSFIAVSEGGILKGTGTTSNLSVAAGATVAPGNSPGILNTGSIVFDMGSGFAVEINGPATGTGYDQLNVTGTVILAEPSLSVSLGYSPQIGDVYTIINNDGNDAITGTFGGLSEGATLIYGAFTVQISYVGGDGNDVTLTVTDVSYTWSGDGSNRDWANPDNWTSGQVPTAGANLVFPDSPRIAESLNNLDPGTAFNSITIAGAGYDIYGNSITLAAGITTTYSSGNSSFALDTTLSSGQAFNIANGGSLTIDGKLSGSSTLTKTGLGNLRLTNTGNEAAYSGNLDVSEGTLAVSDDDALPGGTLIFSGGFFAITGDTTIDNAIVLATSATTISVGMDVTATLSGVISETDEGLAITKSGLGVLVLAGNNTYTGNTNLDGGTLSIADDANLGSGPIQFNQGGTLLVTASTVIDNDIVLNVPGTITTLADVTFSGVIAGTMGLTFDGTSQVTLSGTSTFTGATSVTGGTLRVDGSIAASSGVSIASGAILSGQGVVPVIVADTGSTVSPSGVLSSGGLSASSFSNLVFSIDGTTPGIDYTQIFVSGGVMLDGPMIGVNLFYTPTPGSIFRVIDNDGSDPIVGTFDGLPEGGIFHVNGVALQISYVGGDGNDVTLTTVVTTTISLSSNAGVVTYGDNLTFTAMVSASEGIPTGTVTFYSVVDSQEIFLGSGELNDQGIATFTTTTMDASPSPYAIVAYYDGSEAYLKNKSSSYEQIVNQALLTVTADNLSRGYGEANPTLTATFSGFKNSQTLATSDVTGSPDLATLATSTSPVAGSPYAITASIGTLASGNYTFTFVDGQLAVTQAVTSGTISSSANPAAFGQNVDFTVTISATGSEIPTGDVQFYADNVLLGTATLDVSGQATISLATLSLGSHTITVEYLGDANFQPSSATPLSQTIGQASTVTVSSSVPNPTISGQIVTFTATVSAVAPGAGAPTGTMSFFDGPTLLGMAVVDNLGKASFSTGALGVGTHAITVAYSGDANFAASVSSPISQVVGLASAAVTISAPSTSVLGQTVTITGIVSPVSPGAGLPTGFLTFFDGAVAMGTAPLVNGIASLQTSSMGVNGHVLTVSYSGNASFATSTSAPSLLTVSQGASSAVLSASTTSSVYGQPVTYTAVVNVIPGFGSPTGTVTFYDGTTVVGVAAVSGGSASLTLNTLSVGSHPIVAVYSGDTQFSASQSAASWQSVDFATTATIFLASPNPAVQGQLTTFTAIVSPGSYAPMAPSGFVSFFDGDALIGSAGLVGNQATLTAALFGVDQTHAIRAVYSGDAHYSSSTSATTTQVLQKADVNGFAEFVPVNARSTRFKALVKVATPGGGVPTGTIVFRINGRGFKRVQLVDGQASVRLSRSDLSRYAFSYRYTGDSNCNELKAPDVRYNSSAFAASVRPTRAFARRGR